MLKVISYLGPIGSMNLSFRVLNAVLNFKSFVSQHLINRNFHRSHNDIPKHDNVSLLFLFKYKYWLLNEKLIISNMRVL